MSCPFRDCDGYNEIDCYGYDYDKIHCPLNGLCDSNEPITEVILDYIYQALETEKEARELHNKC